MLLQWRLKADCDERYLITLVHIQHYLKFESHNIIFEICNCHECIGVLLIRKK